MYIKNPSLKIAFRSCDSQCPLWRKYYLKFSFTWGSFSLPAAHKGKSFIMLLGKTWGNEMLVQLGKYNTSWLPLANSSATPSLELCSVSKCGLKCRFVRLGKKIAFKDNVLGFGPERGFESADVGWKEKKTWSVGWCKRYECESERQLIETWEPGAAHIFQQPAACVN